MADTNDILQRLGGAHKDSASSEDVIVIDKPSPVAEAQLSLSNQPQMSMGKRPDMAKKLEEILASTHQPSPELPDK